MLSCQKHRLLLELARGERPIESRRPSRTSVARRAHNEISNDPRGRVLWRELKVEIVGTERRGHALLEANRALSSDSGLETGRFQVASSAVSQSFDAYASTTMGLLQETRRARLLSSREARTLPLARSKRTRLSAGRARRATRSPTTAENSRIGSSLLFETSVIRSWENLIFGSGPRRWGSEVRQARAALSSLNGSPVEPGSKVAR